MTIASIKPAFSTGEISPSLFGRVDLKQFQFGAATMKNFFVNFKGGASSRAGTAFIGRCKQPGSADPPRDIRFQFNIEQSYALEFGDFYMRVKFRGGYITETSFEIFGISNSLPVEITVPGHNFINGDWIFIFSGGNVEELAGQAYIVDRVDGDTFVLVDIFGDFVDSVNFEVYTGGGSLARIYEIATPYQASDLPYLKFDQSADVMTLVHRDYHPYNLTRFDHNNWVLEEVAFGADIAAPTGAAATASATSLTPTQYQYVVTAVDFETGEESIASNIATVTDSVNIGQTAGSIKITWGAVQEAGSYNVYKAPEAFGFDVPIGSIFGYIGSALGASFVDSNVIADFSVTPPLVQIPFYQGQIIRVVVTAGGSGYTSAPTITINTTTGSGAVFIPVILSGALVSVIVVNAGENYVSADTVSISGGGGAGATADLEVGPQTGTYPGLVAYFQQRRVYANTYNNPDTYFLSQPGAYDNFDVSQIPIDSDAIIGTPWAQQVNGIQALVSMPGGLVAFTGLGAWQLNGGGPATPITPASQSVQPQAQNGCSPIVQPIVINYDILFVQAKGSTIRDLAYDFYRNSYTGVDLSMLSAHLFQDHEIVQWAWCEEPWKIVWVLRDDGIMLSFTFLKEQEVAGWARHSTKGLTVSVCSVSEPPVDALYLITRRYVKGQWLYYSERMNNRLWKNDVESSWCVDCGLSLTQPTPVAELQASAADGNDTLSSIIVVNGGSGYVTPSVIITDLTGSGAEATATVVGGVITAITVTSVGSGYTAPQIRINDSTGIGAVATGIISNFITFIASAPVFSSANIGDVIRSGGGIAIITSFVSSTQVIANVTRPIAELVPETDDFPSPQPAGAWTMTTPVTSLRGLSHLSGETVAVLADGAVVEDLVVDNTGEIELPVAASSVVVGLGFVAQLQSLYLDMNTEETIQGKRKNVPSVTVRVEASRGIKVGSNQVDSSTQIDNMNVPWVKMKEVKERGNQIHAGTAIPLFTGDEQQVIPGDWKNAGQVAVQQDYPLPANILAFIPEVVIGDDAA